MSSETERRAFEAWLRARWTPGYAFPRAKDGQYEHRDAQRFWECWQAALAAHPAEPPLPVIGDAAEFLESGEGLHRIRGRSREDVARELRNLRWSMTAAKIEADADHPDMSVGPAEPPADANWLDDAYDRLTRSCRGAGEIPPTLPTFVRALTGMLAPVMGAAEPPRTVTGDEPISLDNDPRRQELFGAAITGAMAFGYQGVNPPPKGHWLTPHWETGRAQAEAQDAAVAQALKGQGAEAPAAVKAARAEAWRKRDINCGCDHNESCGKCFPLKFRKGGLWDQREAVASDALTVKDAAGLSDDRIYSIADQHGHRYRASDEEGMTFDQHAMLDFARAVLAASQP